MPQIDLPTKSKQDYINLNVGSDADIADDKGSMHAKIKDLKKWFYGANSVAKMATLSVASSPTNGSTESPAVGLDITGSGKLHHVTLLSNNDKGFLRITVDGVVVYYGTPGFASNIPFGLIGKDYLQIGYSSTQNNPYVLGLINATKMQFLDTTGDLLFNGSSFPNSSLQTSKSVLLSAPLIFKQSVKVEQWADRSAGYVTNMLAIYELI